MKVLLISPNGLQELSGGGLYLRSLAQALCGVRGVSQVTVVSKDMGDGEIFDFPSHCQRVYLEKNKTRDVVARLRLYPTYLMTSNCNFSAEQVKVDRICSFDFFEFDR